MAGTSTLAAFVSQCAPAGVLATGAVSAAAAAPSKNRASHTPRRTATTKENR
jgi:hypothetical protein